MDKHYALLSRNEASAARRLLAKLRGPCEVGSSRDDDHCFDVSKLRNLAARLYAARHDRRFFFTEDLFWDPAWDMLLTLYCAWVDRELISVTSLVYSSHVPASTGLRWVRILEDAGFIVRSRDNSDGRRIHVSPSAEAVVLMEKYLKRVAETHFPVSGCNETLK